MRCLIVHPGVQYAPRLAGQLARRGMLHRYWTGFGIGDGGWLGGVVEAMPSKLRRSLANRRIPGVAAELIRLRPWLEMSSTWQLRRKRSGAEAILHRRNRLMQASVPDDELAAADIVVGFDTSSRVLAGRCRKLGKPFVLDQSIAHPVAKARVYETLRSRFPDWAESLPLKSPEHLADEAAEHALATAIVAPSAFVRDTLVAEGVSADKIAVNPFGTDLSVFRPPEEDRGTAGTLVVLFVGTISARKGVPLLLEAWRRLAPKGAELWIAGSGNLPDAERVRGLPASVRLLGGMSRPDVATLMRRASVLVFPSFFEGLAQVQVEAMASGLPVIGTVASGAADLVTPGVDGLVLPTGDLDSLVNALEECIAHPERVREMRERVLERRPSLSWDRYGDRWQDMLGAVGRNEPVGAMGMRSGASGQQQAAR